MSYTCTFTYTYIKIKQTTNQSLKDHFKENNEMGAQLIYCLGIGIQATKLRQYELKRQGNQFSWS